MTGGVAVFPDIAASSPCFCVPEGLCSLLPADTPQLGPTLGRAATLQQPAWDMQLTPRMCTRL